VLAPAALLLLAGALATAPITNNDIFLHLKTGDLVLTTGAIPHLDDYSALARGRPFVAHEWLAGVVFRLAQLAAGWNGLIALKIFLSVLLAGLLLGAARRAGAAVEVAVPLLAFALYLAAPRLMERPHLFTFLMTAAFLRVLLPGAGGRATPLWPLSCLQVVWANLHGGFVLGPVLAALAALARLLDRDRREGARLALLVPVLAAACLLNPYGIELLRFPFALTGSAFMGEIYEWLPPYTEPFASTRMARMYVVWIGLAFLILGFALVRALRGRATPPGGTLPILVFGAFLYLSLRMNRNVADFALATAPGVAAAATPLLSGAGRSAHRTAVLRAAGGLLCLGLTVWTALFGYGYAAGAARRRFGFGLGENIPVAAVDYLERNNVRGNVFNTYAAGAYLVWRLHPSVRVAMDSRNDVYGETLYREHAAALRDTGPLGAMLARIEARAILLEWPMEGTVATAAAIRGLGGWRPVYFDDVAVVYLDEGGPLGDLARRDGYRILEPVLFRPGLLRPEEAAIAIDEAGRAVRTAPGAFMPRIMLADALLAAGRREEGLAEESRLFAADPPLYFVHNHLGLMRLAAGDAAAAERRFRRALDLNPASRVAKFGLERAAAVARPPTVREKPRDDGP
jgi:tetratricopeptide (TPR) repeat protein